MNQRNKKRWIKVLMGLSLAAMAIPMIIKIVFLDYSFQSMIPTESYQIRNSMSFTGNGDDLIVRTFLPVSLEHQRIENLTVSSGDLNWNRERTPHYENISWSKYNAQGDHYIDINYQVLLQRIQYEIPMDLPLPDQIPPSLQPYLKHTDVIQVNHQEISDLAQELRQDEESLLNLLENIYYYVYQLGSKPFKGTTDALTTLRLGEASCNGKSRLFVALCRNLGIPSRLVGGLILNTGTKRTSHQWLEVYVNGHWVPMDALNGHFASLPENYLTLYVGDKALFTHSRDIGFNYHFDIQKKTITNPQINRALRENTQIWFTLIDGLLKGGLSLSILQFLLVIPFAVVFVVLFKNVIGLKTYGTFLPALMAMAIQDTGLSAGILAFILVLVITVLIRFPLERLGLLHTPKLAIMMLTVIISLVILSALSILFQWEGFSALNSAAVFPIAILTITSERIALTISEEGVKSSVNILLQTLVVVTVCYFIIRSVALQALVLIFPELLFGVLVLNLWMGSWTGIRISEFFRFRRLLLHGEKDGQ